MAHNQLPDVLLAREQQHQQQAAVVQLSRHGVTCGVSLASGEISCPTYFPCQQLLAPSCFPGAGPQEQDRPRHCTFAAQPWLTQRCVTHTDLVKNAKLGPMRS